MKRVSLLLALLILLGACDNGPAIESVESSDLALTLTPNIDIPPTLTPTPVPTHTSTPARSSSSTPTPTAAPTEDVVPYKLPSPSSTPTLTPLVPTPDLAANYKLADWTSELANQLIATLQAYPDTLSTYHRGYHDSVYYDSYRYAAFAQLEALSRFPEAEGANWQWNRAYNLAQMGDDQVGDAYAALISEALNGGETNLDDLPSWFEAHEPSLQLNAIHMEALPGYISSYLIELHSYQSNGAYLWLLESPTDFQVYPLKSDWDFGFAHDVGISFTLADVTGDSVAEVITIHEHQPGGIGMLVGNFDIFDLSQTPPRKLEFDPNNPYSAYGSWSIISEEKGLPTLHFENMDDNLFCPATIDSNHSWNGKVFALSHKRYPNINKLIDQTTERDEVYCSDWVLRILLDDAKRGNKDALKSMEDLLSDYPFVSINSVTGEPYPPDLRDEMRFQLALLDAFFGDFESTRRQMTIIATNPVVEDSQWRAPAQEFLTAYQTEADLSDSCAAAETCYPFLSIPQLVELASTQPPETIVDFLQQVGVPVLSIGAFDFDEDGFDDYWLLIERQRADWNEVWILMEVEGHLKPYYLGIVGTSAEPITIKTSRTHTGLRAISFQIGIDKLDFTFQRNADTNKLEIEQIYYLPSMHHEMLNTLAKDLLAGSNPKQVAARIQQLQQDIAVACEDEVMLLYGCHDLFFSQYLLGLSYELAGDEANAVAAYHRLWRSYPHSPYAIMAQVKLKAIP